MKSTGTGTLVYGLNLDPSQWTTGKGFVLGNAVKPEALNENSFLMN